VTRLRAIVVDDERLARRELARLLAPHADTIEIVGEADSVDAGVALVAAHDPDVVFLDIQMPRRSGFELLEACEVRGRVVFVTAHDVHAIRAFEVNALDYLMKPVHPDRLAQTIGRLVTATPPPAAEPAARLQPDDRLFLSEGRAARFVRVASIACLRGADDYAELVLVDGGRVLSRRTLREWEERLPETFARVHRTAIANLDLVERVERTSPDAYRIVLRGIADPIPLSRRHAARLKERRWQF
jgi:two-component system LytT family response regulator